MKVAGNGGFITGATFAFGDISDTRNFSMSEPEAAAEVCDIVCDVLSEGSGPDSIGAKALVYRRGKGSPSIDSRFM